jgi:hypothetical protein
MPQVELNASFYAQFPSLGPTPAKTTTAPTACESLAAETSVITDETVAATISRPAALEVNPEFDELHRDSEIWPSHVERAFQLGQLFSSPPSLLSR